MRSSSANVAANTPDVPPSVSAAGCTRRRRTRPAAPSSRGAGRRPRLRRGAAVHDAIGGEALQRADRAAVVAELGVEVVLHHVAVDGARPLDQLVAAARRQRHTARALVGRGDDGDPGRGGAQPLDDEPVPVDRHRLDRYPGAGQPSARRRVAGVLDGERPVPQHLDEQVERVAEPGADDDPVRVGVDPPHPRQVLGQLDAQPRQPAPVLVGELGGTEERRAARPSTTPGRGNSSWSGRPGRKSTWTACAVDGTRAGPRGRGAPRRSRPCPRPAGRPRTPRRRAGRTPPRRRAA